MKEQNVKKNCHEHGVVDMLKIDLVHVFSEQSGCERAVSRSVFITSPYFYTDFLLDYFEACCHGKLCIFNAAVLQCIA